MAGKVRYRNAWHGTLGSGNARQGRRGESWMGAVRSGFARRGKAGVVWNVGARLRDASFCWAWLGKEEQ